MSATVVNNIPSQDDIVQVWYMHIMLRRFFREETSLYMSLPTQEYV